MTKSVVFSFSPTPIPTRTNIIINNKKPKWHSNYMAWPYTHFFIVYNINNKKPKWHSNYMAWPYTYFCLDVKIISIILLIVFFSYGRSDSWSLCMVRSVESKSCVGRLFFFFFFFAV